MKRLMAGIALMIGTAALSGCYYDPGYSYVRSTGYQGDAYYGDGGATVYDDGYAAPAYYGAPGYYGSGYYGGYAPGVNVDIGTIWYSGSRGHYRRYDHDDRRWRDSGRDHGWQRGHSAGEARYQYHDDSHRGGDHRRQDGRGSNDRWHGRHGDHDGH